MTSTATDPVSIIRGLSLQQGVVYVAIVGLEGVSQGRVTRALEQIGIDDGRARSLIRSLETKGLIKRKRVSGRGNPNLIWAPLDPFAKYLEDIIGDDNLYKLAVDLITLGINEKTEPEDLPKIRKLYIGIHKVTEFKTTRVRAPLAIVMYYLMMISILEARLLNLKDPSGFIRGANKAISIVGMPRSIAKRLLGPFGLKETYEEIIRYAYTSRAVSAFVEKIKNEYDDSRKFLDEKLFPLFVRFMLSAAWETLLKF